jgi:hypothetical protein
MVFPALKISGPLILKVFPALKISGPLILTVFPDFQIGERKTLKILSCKSGQNGYLVYEQNVGLSAAVTVL